MEGLALNSPSHRQGHSLLLLPYRGDVKDFDGNLKYRYDHEKSTPYNYSVYLDDFSVGVDLCLLLNRRSIVFGLRIRIDG